MGLIYIFLSYTLNIANHSSEVNDLLEKYVRDLTVFAGKLYFCVEIYIISRYIYFYFL